MKNLTKVAPILILFISLFSACNKCIEGEGSVISEVVQIDDFTKFSVGIPSTVTVSQGTEQSVIITAQPNIINDFNTEVKNGNWNIELRRGECYKKVDISIEIVVPFLHKVDVSGSGDVTINDFVGQFDLSADISGSGSITANRFDGLEMLDVEISGSGEFICNEMNDPISIANVKISGSGSYEGFNMPTAATFVDISGSGSCETRVSGQLDVNISGEGSVYYKGMPTITENISGSGEVIDAN